MTPTSTGSGPGPDPDHRRTAAACLTSLILGLLAAGPARTANLIDWPAANWNPVPLPDDLVVPMPCNGTMAFRVIAIGPEPRTLDEGTDFSELTGPLPLGPDGQGAYLLGKYEVTRLQAAALRAYAQDTDCPNALDPEQVGRDQTSRGLAADQRRPEARIAWDEARGLAADFAAWLRLLGGRYPDCDDRGRQSGPCIPRIDGEAAMVRLPTEPEWEYAARGGQAVSAAAFRNPLPPLTAGFDRHAWTKANAGADPWPIGSRLAGPLGLHDIFGNISEIQYATEPSERGEVFIARGGGYQSQPGQADSRYRDRFRIYDAQGRGRLSETGLRLLIGAPVLGPRASPAPEPQGAPEPDPSTAPSIATGLPLWRTSWLALLLVGLVLIQGLGLLRLLWRRRAALPEPSAPEASEPGASAPTSPRARERALGLSPADRARIARQLFALGYVLAGATPRPRRRFSAAQRKAIGAFEQDLGQTPTGHLSAPLLAALTQRVAALSPVAGIADPNAAQPVPPSTDTAAGSSRKPDSGTAPSVPKAPFDIFRDRLNDGSKGPEMVALPGGRFQMGSPASEPGRRDDERQHMVHVSPFAIGRTEVTFDEYEVFAEATGRELPSHSGSRRRWRWFRGRGRQPVSGVSWHDATAYVEWLSEQTGSPYRLPTEAEWEYAARAGTDTRWSFGDDQANLAKHAWYYKNSDAKAHVVATRKPNPWKLYDMHGNVREWVSDWYGPYPAGDEVRTNPTGPASGSSRVLRGGAFNDWARFLRSSSRDGFRPEVRFRIIGFRCARAPRRQP